VLGRLLCLLAFPVLGSAGIIVQTGGAGEDWSSVIEPFPFEPNRLRAVEATFTASVMWDVWYEFSGPEFVPLNPPARITTRGFGGGSLNLPGGAAFFTPEIVCELLVAETTSLGIASCEGGAASPDKWVGDPRNPMWFAYPIYAGDASGGAEASCVSGVPDVSCSVTPRHVYARFGYELKYYYDEDYPVSSIPEPGSVGLVSFALVAGAIAVRRRG